MAFKFFLLAALVACSNAVYTHQPQSAASPAQIAFAMSQNYDQTGPGAHLPLVQQETSTTSQDFTTQQQQVYPQQQFNQQQTFHQPGYTVQQQYTNQPQSYSNPPHTYSTQQQVYASPPQAYVNQPQVYSSQQHSQLSYAQPQVAYSHSSPSYAPVAQPSQVSYPQVSYPQAGPVSYSHAPQIVYSSSPHMAYPPQPAQAFKATSFKAVQPEVYEGNPQYGFSYINQHDGPGGESKGPEELSQGAYALIGAEGHQEPNTGYSQLLQRQPPTKNYISVPQQQAYLAPAVKPVYSSQQYYSAPAASKNVYSGPSGSRNSLLSGPKNMYSSYISKFSSPLSQQ